MATKAKSTVDHDDLTDENTYEIQDLDFEPRRHAAGGRAKSPLRVKIEALEVGQRIFTGTVVQGNATDTSYKNTMGKIRSMTQAVTDRTKTESGDDGWKFSVYVSDDDRLPMGAVIVERKA